MKSTFLKTCLIVLAVVLSSGCAVTGAYTDDKVGLSLDGSTSANWAENVSIGCGEKIYSIMVSVLIPLPPVIPVPWFRDSATLKITNYGHDYDAPRVYLLLHSNTGIAEHQIHQESELSNYADNPSKSWFFPLPEKCTALNGAQLKIQYKKLSQSSDWTTEIYDLRYSNNGVNVEWFYFINN